MDNDTYRAYYYDVVLKSSVNLANDRDDAGYQRWMAEVRTTKALMDAKA